MKREQAHPMRVADQQKLAWLAQHFAAPTGRANKKPSPPGLSPSWLDLNDYLRAHKHQLRLDDTLVGLQEVDGTPGAIDHIILVSKHGKCLWDSLSGTLTDGHYVSESGKSYVVAVRVSVWTLTEWFSTEKTTMGNIDTAKAITAALIATAAKSNSNFATDVLIQGSKHLLSRTNNLHDFMASLIGWVRDDSPELASVWKQALAKFSRFNATAAFARWASVKDDRWYKALMVSTLGPFDDDEKIWIKINTEKPLNLGKTVWIYGPVSGKVMHVTFDVLGEYVRPYVVQGKLQFADAQQQRRLDQAWEPIVDEVIHKWQIQQRRAKKLLKTK